MNTPDTARKGRRMRIGEVARATRLTPNMHRVTLTGADLEDFPPGQESAHIKFVLPDPGQSRADFEAMIEDGRNKELRRRTYTVRHHRPDVNELDVDFVVHEGGGPACDWALAAKSGSFIGIGGPGPKKAPDVVADWYAFGADMSAIPAAAACIEELPADAVGHAFFEILSEDDRQEVNAPPGIEIHWHVHSDVHTPSMKQLEFLQSLDWSKGKAGVFVAGEGNCILALRKYLREDLGLDKREMYLSSYWVIGLAEDEHQIAKRAFAA